MRSQMRITLPTRVTPSDNRCREPLLSPFERYLT